MSHVTSNDNEHARTWAVAPATDAPGYAALLLVESLVHGLIARSTITVADAVEIVAVALEVNEEFAAEPNGNQATTARSLTLLSTIRASLSRDLPAG